MKCWKGNSTMRKTVIITVATFVVLPAIGLCYYYLGNHNCLLSRSYFLEKEIRQLHYMETHETVPSYVAAAQRYTELLRRIRFASTSEKLDEKYAKAVRRAQVKAEICELVDHYFDHHDRESLTAANKLYSREAARSLAPFDRIIHRGASIDSPWFARQQSMQVAP